MGEGRRGSVGKNEVGSERGREEKRVGGVGVYEGKLNIVMDK